MIVMKSEKKQAIEAHGLHENSRSKPGIPVYLGNDVVDLSAPRAMGRGRDRRFIEKILTPREQSVLETVDDPDTHIWRYWAAKESAYKALSRYHPDITSAPGRYDVTWNAKNDPRLITGSIRAPGMSLDVICGWNGDKICCVTMGCAGSPVPEISVGAELIGPEQGDDFDRTTTFASRRVREAAIRSIARYYQRDIRSVTICRTETGPPDVFFDGVIRPIVLSLSHDGRFVFFAWCPVPSQGRYRGSMA
jgi:phosphopantetheinyl transferase (holo-ACP synthase)